MDNRHSRTIALLGRENLEKLQNSTICVCGLGGVGSYTAMSLARVGVGKMIVVDKDIVDESNINRQLVASFDTIGQDKVKVIKDMIKSVNKDCEVIDIKLNIDKDSINSINLSDCDYVADCIDNIDSKVELVKLCNKIPVPIISAMGAANKLDPTRFKIADIYKTSYDPIAKIMRHKLKELGIKKLNVVYSDEESIKTDGVLGSVSYVPSVMGLIMSYKIIDDIVNKKDENL